MTAALDMPARIIGIDGEPFLTITELQVLDHLADGRTRAQAAARMSMAADTVSGHLQRISRKIGCGTQSGMVGYAYRTGLSGRRPAPVIVLSARGTQVVRRIADGMSNREAAEDLGLGVDTVKTHLRLAVRALDARSRAHAVRRAVDAGALPLSWWMGAP